MSFLLTCTVQDPNYALCKPGQAMSRHKFHHVPSPPGAYWGNRREGVKVKEKNLTVPNTAQLRRTVGES